MDSADADLDGKAGRSRDRLGDGPADRLGSGPGAADTGAPSGAGRFRRAKAVAAGLALVAVASAAAVAWLRPPPLAVELARAERGPMRVTVDEQGETRVRDRYVIAAPVSGRLLRPQLREGDPVAPGQVVARIAPLPLAAREREELAARLAAAEALRREAEQRARHAQADQALAQQERRRIEQLVARGFQSPAAAEQAQNAELTAAAEAEAARERAASAAADVRAARAGLLALGDPRAGPIELRSPAAGAVLQVLERSERVVAAGMPLLAVADVSRLEVVVELLTTEAVKVRPGMPAELDDWGGGPPLAARVRTVEPHAFTKISALGVEEKRTIVVLDLDAGAPALGDGYRVEARIVVWSSPEALKVPAAALFRCDPGWCVFVVDAGRARLRRVQLAERTATEARVVDGLVEGEPVVLHPGNRVEDGMRVRDARAAAAAVAPAALLRCINPCGAARSYTETVVPDRAVWSPAT